MIRILPNINVHEITLPQKHKISRTLMETECALFITHIIMDERENINDG
jgi:hypothetical protein